MAFELTDLSTGNVIGVYSTQDAAFRDVRDAIADGGPAAVATLALAVDDPTGDSDGSIIAEGDALVALVQHTLGSAAA